MKTAAALLLACVSGAFAAGSWSIISSNVATIATGIWFKDNMTGFLPADENGEGSEIIKSTDGGKTWTANEPHQGGFLFLDVAGYGDNVVVSGVFGEEYSTDGGNHFNTSIGGGQGQCVRAVGDRNNPDAIAVVGEFGLFDPKNGVAISTDGGVIFTEYDAKLFTDARYGAFPSADFFYLSAGNWPESNDDNFNNDNNNNNFPPTEKDTIPRTPSFELRWSADKKSYQPYVRLAGRDERVTSNDTIFQTEISVSQDGGKTWKMVYENKGEYYPNGIACQNETSCCFTAEADAGSTPGAHIFCSSDSGATWTQKLFLSGATESLIDIAATGTAGEYWAVGGTQSLTGGANFFHSTDGGDTWTLDTTIKGQYATCIDCVDASHCWATCVDVLTQESSVAALTA